MSNELKPCPFCGCEHVSIKPNIHTGLNRAVCEGCWATSVCSTSREVIVAAWNRRTEARDE